MGQGDGIGRTTKGNTSVGCNKRNAGVDRIAGVQNGKGKGAIQRLEDAGAVAGPVRTRKDAKTGTVRSSTQARRGGSSSTSGRIL